MNHFRSFLLICALGASGCTLNATESDPSPGGTEQTGEIAQAYCNYIFQTVAYENLPLTGTDWDGAYKAVNGGVDGFEYCGYYGIQVTNVRNKRKLQGSTMGWWRDLDAIPPEEAALWQYEVVLRGIVNPRWIYIFGRWYRIPGYTDELARQTQQASASPDVVTFDPGPNGVQYDSFEVWGRVYKLTDYGADLKAVHVAAKVW